MSFVFGASCSALAQVVATTVPSGAVSIDGALDEPEWATAPPVTDFNRFQPIEGGAPRGTTEVRFLQDETALYVGIRVRDAGYHVRARISPREDINSDDQVGVYLDTFHDGRSGYIFYLNPLGIQQDLRANGSDWSFSWDTVLRSDGDVDEDGRGFTIELAIPWRSVKYPGGDGPQTWGVILTRKIPLEGSKYSWPVLERNHPALFTQAATLTGVSPAPSGSGLELIPSLTIAQAWTEDPETGAAPAFDALDFDPWHEAIRPSLDLRFGLTPDLSLAGTANPDFSQVESDVADVRLNARFAFQFPERRPFFLDGVDAYQDRQDTLYTRSIADPFYGVKLTGRAGPASVGIVHALDRAPLPSFHEDGTPGFDVDDVEGAVASNTLARLRLDAGRSGQVGLTLADKRLDNGGTYDGIGVDSTLPLPDRWIVGASLQESMVQDGLDTLLGLRAEGGVSRSDGIGAGGWLWGGTATEDFRREMGFQPQSGNAEASSGVNYTFEREEGLVETFVPEVEAYLFVENDGDRFSNLQGAVELGVAGNREAWAGGGVNQRRQDGVDVNGGSFGFGFWTELSRYLEFSPEFEFERSVDFGTLTPANTLDGSLSAVVRPTPGIRIDLDANATRHAPEGSPVERANLQRIRFGWQFTRPLGARVVVQHDRVDEAEGVEDGLQLSPLLTFLSAPGTAAYLGWTEQLDLTAGETAERVVFAKVSVLFRP